MDCIFCKIINKELPAEIIAENDHTIVIKDIAPKAPIHYLIIPKVHFKNIQEAEGCCVTNSMVQAARQLGHSDYRLVINNGHQAGQRVFHLHMHYLAGSELSDL